MDENALKRVAADTPDPERCLRNLTTFIEEHPHRTDEAGPHLRPIAHLFSHSQFLANYCISAPDYLFAALRDIDNPSAEEDLSFAIKRDIDAILKPPDRNSLPQYMNVVRRFRLKEFLKITLRDILKKADLVDIMLEMSMLADVIINASLGVVREMLHNMYGAPDNEQFAVIALGKLGAEELNYSSDVDFIYIYGTEIGETSGILSDKGIAKNRISNHEYYSKVGEELARFLSQNTEAGFAYRVDLRLRPEGQRGALALALRGYEMYYQYWGRAWERAMLLRARPVAGEEELGGQFMEMIRPFVFRKYLDFTAIDEICNLKTRIDSTFKRNDIKRGYGGIREIEFFAQALQLIYAGREPLLRERSTLRTLHRLLQKGLIGLEDYGILSDNYRYLRTLEHRLQQVNDLQTHTLPSGEHDLAVIGRKMGYPSKEQFMDDLEKRRGRVRSIYDSLFAAQQEAPTRGRTLFDEDFSDTELKEILSGSGLRDVNRGLRNIRAIQDSIFNFQTLRGRRLLSEILPGFVDSSLKSGNPDMALNHLQSFALLLSTNESYIEVFSKNRTLIDLIVTVFSQSNYLAKMLMTRPQYLEMIGWQETHRKSLAALRRETGELLAEGHSIGDAIRLLKQTEEIRLGLLFLQKGIDLVRLTHGLSRTAEAILEEALKHDNGLQGDISLISFGKLGGREITFDSDLDLIFVAGDEVNLEKTKLCEKLLRLLISYTRDGIAYSVDTRLRPEGTKGPLVSPIAAFRKYYAEAAAFWEFQALLKARPVAGSRETGTRFMHMAHEALTVNGERIASADVIQMRERILRERAKESEGYDIKLGTGGIEEIEFMVQFLQLRNCRKQKNLLVQNTLSAIRRLSSAGIISEAEGRTAANAYLFFRTMEGLLRLRGEGVLKKDEVALRAAAEFIGEKGPEELVRSIERSRVRVRDLFDKYLRNS